MDKPSPLRTNPETKPNPLMGSNNGAQKPSPIMDKPSPLRTNPETKPNPLMGSNNGAQKASPLMDKPSPLRTNPETKPNPLMGSNNGAQKASPLMDKPNPLQDKNDEQLINELKNHNAKLELNNEKQNFSYQNDAIVSNNIDLVNDSGNLVAKSLEDNSFEANEKYIRAFLGNNSDKFLKRKFNFCAFFFNSFYLFYRRYALLGLIYIIILGVNLSLAFNLYVNKKILPKQLLFFVLFMFILNLIIGFIFNYMYKKRAIKVVNKIKEKSHNKDSHSIRVECAKRGGVKKQLVLASAFFNVSCVIVVFSLVVLPFLRIKLTNVLDLPVEDTTDYEYFIGEAKKLYNDAYNKWISELITKGVIEAFSDIDDKACGISIYDDKNQEKLLGNANNTVAENEKETIEDKKTTEQENDVKEDDKTINYLISINKKRYVTKFFATYKDYRIAYDKGNLQLEDIGNQVYLLKKQDHNYCEKYLGKYCYKIYKKIVDNYIRDFIREQEKIRKGEYNFNLTCNNDKPTINDLN